MGRKIFKGYSQLYIVCMAMFFILFKSFAASADELPSPAALQDSEHKGGVVLALSGGGTKGFAHIGVLKILEREKIPVVGIVGTSIGAMIGGLYATGYSSDEIYKIISSTNVMGLIADSGTRIRPDSGNHRPTGENIKLYQKNFNKKLKVTGPLGFIQANSLVNFLTKYTGHIRTTDFNRLPIPFACVAADLSTGQEVVMRDGSLASAIRASISIPGLFEPWPLDGKLLVDGGLVANLPVNIAKKIFPGYPVIAVNLAGDTTSKPSESFKSVVDVMLQTIDIMTLDRRADNEANADIVLYPDLTGCGMLDAAGYDNIYKQGINAAEANLDRLISISQSAPPASVNQPQKEQDARIVRKVRIEGIHKKLAEDMEKAFESWIGLPYDVEKVNRALERMSRMEDVATADIDTLPAAGGNQNDVELLFSLEKRPAFEIGADGYTSNLHSHRWLAITMNARDLASAGDSAYLDTRFGNSEWGAVARYFTPLIDRSQWGFSLSARKDRYSPWDMESYSIERYSARVMYYHEYDDRRFGFGLAGEHTNTNQDDDFVAGPYLYLNLDTLDNILLPTKGYSLNSQIWWNSENIFVSKSKATAYLPIKNNLLLIFDAGLKTGDKESQAYRALLGSHEELFSLSARPYAGDQAAWARVGVGRDFYSSWWGSLRGEFFATYGMVMNGWRQEKDAWETGLALSVPGQFVNGKVLLVYDDRGELTVGFTVGMPRWWDSPLP